MYVRPYSYINSYFYAEQFEKNVFHGRLLDSDKRNLILPGRTNR